MKWLLREVVRYPSLKVFKQRLDTQLSGILLRKALLSYWEDGQDSLLIPSGSYLVYFLQGYYFYIRLSSHKHSHSFLWLTRNYKLVNWNMLRNLAPSSGPWIVFPYHTWSFLLHLCSCAQRMVAKNGQRRKSLSVSWIIKVLSSLFETPKRKEITRTDLGIERKWDKECNHYTSEWFSEWHLYIKNM